MIYFGNIGFHIELRSGSSETHIADFSKYLSWKPGPVMHSPD
jgi:hypothetical protein